MKYEYKKHGKELYGAAKIPTLITIPPLKFIMINGKGDPNGEDFSERVGVLYSLAYPIKMRHKNFCKNNPVQREQFEFSDFTVFPLEGLWTSESEDPTQKDKFIYTIMIRQPDFIDREMFDAAMAETKKKKPHPLLEEVTFGAVEDGLCVQMLHNGSFDDEPASFAMMDEFARDKGYERINHVHREIYLNDPRKTSPEKRKTVLRYQVRKS